MQCFYQNTNSKNTDNCSEKLTTVTTIFFFLFLFLEHILETKKIPIHKGLSKYDIAQVRELAWQSSVRVNTGEEEKDEDVATRLVFLPRNARKGANMWERKELIDTKIVLEKLIRTASSSSSSSSSISTVSNAKRQKVAHISTVVDRLAVVGGRKLNE